MRIKAWIAALALAGGIATPVAAIARDGIHEKTVGLTAGYIGHNNSAVAGIEFSYRFSNHFRLAPQALYAFRHNEEDALIINLNAEVPFDLGEKWEIYPLAGLNYTSWNFHGNKVINDDSDVTSRITRFGLNVGGGVAINISTTLRIGAEFQWALVKGYNSANAMAKIAYIF